MKTFLIKLLIVLTTFELTPAQPNPSIDGISLGMTEAQADKEILGARPYKHRVGQQRISYSELPGILEGAVGPMIDFSDSGVIRSIAGHRLRVLGRNIECTQELSVLNFISHGSEEFKSGRWLYRFYPELNLVVRIGPDNYPIISGLRLFLPHTPPRTASDVAW